MLIGRVGQLEVKGFTDNNGTKKCATFSLATSEKYKDRQGNWVENTEWHNIVSWNHAEMIEKYVQKGSQLYIEGKLRTRTWEDKQGNKRYVTEILAEKIDLLGSKNTSQPAHQAPSAPVQQKPKVQSQPIQVFTEDEVGEDLPF
jgi:single-strand DNA-binding protein